MQVLALVLFFWTLAWGILGLIGLAQGQAFGLLCLAFAGGPIGLVWLNHQRKSAVQTGHHSKMLADAGVAQGSDFEFSELGQGIAINSQARTLTLRSDAMWKTYPYGDVREWGTELANFFVTVRDIANPKWYVSMNNRAIQSRWMEILRQQINDK